jgi:hypothetical protein
MVTWLHWFLACDEAEHHGREYMTEHSCSSHWLPGSRMGWGKTRCSPQGHATSDLLPPVRLHFLKFPEPPKIVPPATDQAFNT